jgi:hypothetical protein
MLRVPVAVCLLATLAAGAALAQTQTTETRKTETHKVETHKVETQKPAAPAPMSHAGPKTDKALIASAMSAAPPAVARHAAIVDIGPNGAARVVRKGASGFTCMADNPETPGPDPMCLDANAMEWAKAWMGHQPPPQKAGFLYMLAGGTDASNTDPYAKAPSKTNHWIKTGPHVMIVGAPETLAHYPTSPDPDTSQPYVMWAGTPYAHLMLPVR